MGEKNVLQTVENVRNRVYVIREQQVMLDYDLAELYGYEVKRLNEQVKNNKARFPEDFMFKLTKSEVEYLRSNISTANINPKSRALPHAFTEQGIYMLATVLRGELAEQQSIFIMRAFREMRHYIKQNQQFLMQSELNIVSAKVSELSVDMAGVKDWEKKTNQKVEEIQKNIDVLNENFISDKDFKNYVIYKNQKFEADVAYIYIYQQASKSIYVVDDYMNTKTLQLLSQKNKGVEVELNPIIKRLYEGIDICGRICVETIEEMRNAGYDWTVIAEMFDEKNIFKEWVQWKDAEVKFKEISETLKGNI